MTTDETSQTTAPAGAYVEIKGLTKRFGATEVLKGVDLTVEKGHIAGLIGPSGSGKSVLLRCINGLTDPDTGSVAVDGKDVFPKQWNLRQLRKTVGMVFQQYHLFPHRTALENVMIGPTQVLGRSKAEAREKAEDLLGKLHIADRADLYPGELSGGQQVRVAIARALAMEPDLVLLDEPTGALDRKMANAISELVLDYRDKGVTWITASHDLEFLKHTADDVMFLHDGVVVEQGPKEVVLTNPSDDRTRSFLGVQENREFGQRLTDRMSKQQLESLIRRT